jgi:hypothetical protein
MSSEWVWTQTGGNSWSVRRASPPSDASLTPWRPTPGPYEALLNRFFYSQTGEEQQAHANANAQALAASGQSDGARLGLDAALAGNVWAYLSGLDGRP